MKRNYIVAGNWKMNLLRNDALSLASEINHTLTTLQGPIPEVVLFPPAVHLSGVTNICLEGKLKTGIQNCSEHQKGAYTGEVSAEMAQSAGARYVLLGHSERRQYHFETDLIINLKLKQVLQTDLIPIICVGESETEREQNNQFTVVKNQLKICLNTIENLIHDNIVIAYEPVWAIGTGKTASVVQAQEMHSFIRGCLKELGSERFSDGVRILYGGSCNENNASDLFKAPDIDGGLIGGASLKTEPFIKIIKAAM